MLVGMQSFRIVVAAGLLASSFAIALGDREPQPISEKDMPRAERWIDDLKRKLAVFDAYVAEKDWDVIREARTIGGISDLKRDMRDPHPNIDFRLHPQFPELDKRLMQLRTELARRGRYVGEWKEWKYDGQTVAPEDEKFIQSVEGKANSLTHAGQTSPGNDELIAKLKEILARKEFTSNPVLKVYKDTLGQHVLYGVVFRDSLLRIRYLADTYRSLQEELGRGNWKNCAAQCKKRIHDIASEVVSNIDKVKAAGRDLKDHKYKVDKNEPLSEEWDLIRVRAEAVKISKK